MTNRTIFLAAEPIGTLTATRAGLYYTFQCNLTEPPTRPLRIYVLSGYDAEYLGIPDADGTLTARIPVRHFAAEPSGALATALPRGAWHPWRGELDGVAVDFCLIKKESDALTVALPPEECVKFPQWLPRAAPITLNGQPYSQFRLTPTAHFPESPTEPPALRAPNAP